MADKKATSGKDKKKNGGGKKGTAPKKTPAKKTPPKKSGGNAKRDNPPPDQPKEVLAADLPDSLRTAMNNLVNYSWDDEMRSAEEFARENGNVEGHVFADLVTVRNFLDGKNDDPMDLLDLEDDLDDESRDEDDEEDDDDDLDD